MLEQVERAGLFLVPLDEVRGWWRYHQLFADLLSARLQQERPSRVVALHRAAAAWHEERGLADDAIRHALAEAGVADEQAEQALAGLDPESERARLLVGKLGATAKTLAALRRKGFTEDALESIGSFAEGDERA